jgi:C4-dicarboxylate-specific signal transduction histidine kinase
MPMSQGAYFCDFQGLRSQVGGCILASVDRVTKTLALTSVTVVAVGLGLALVAANLSSMEHTFDDAGRRFSGWNVAIVVLLITLATIAALQSFRRREAEENLLVSEERLTMVASAAQLCLWSAECPIVGIAPSKQCCAVLDIALQEWISVEALVSEFHPDDRSTARRALEALGAGKESETVEVRKIMADGSVRWLLFSGHAQGTVRRRPRQVIGFFVDISERKRAEEDSDNQHRELAHLVRVSALGRLSGAIAHELNQPLTAILSNAQAARRLLSSDKPDLVEALGALDDIVSEDNRAGEVIHRLRGLLRKETSTQAALDLNELLTSTIHIVRAELIGRQTTVKCELAPDLPVVSGDSVQLQQVLLNLILNAMDAMTAVAPADRVIALRTGTNSAGLVEVAVTDQGRGITPTDAARLFRPFFTTKPNGLGLGLSICSTIVRKHGGELSLNNNNDRGATATVVLPTS